MDIVLQLLRLLSPGLMQHAKTSEVRDSVRKGVGANWKIKTLIAASPANSAHFHTYTHAYVGRDVKDGIHAATVRTKVKSLPEETVDCHPFFKRRPVSLPMAFEINVKTAMPSVMQHLRQTEMTPLHLRIRDIFQQSERRP